MPWNLDQNPAPGNRHYNIHFKDGGLYNGVTIRAFEGLRPEDIEWVWIVEEGQRATLEAIRQLCAFRNKH